MNFQKPENALRRAEELVSLGQQSQALQVLHQTIGHKKFRVQEWDFAYEQIMVQYVGLCVDLKNLVAAREGLHQYRAVAHIANPVSLGKIVKEFRDAAENALTDAKDKIKTEELLNQLNEDLEAGDTPESLLQSMLGVKVRDEAVKEVQTRLTLCWETYKIILDLVRSTPKQERAYHETAQRALKFCLTYKRQSEFKKLCETIRNHYAQIQKAKINKAENEALIKPEVQLETRLEQLKVAAALDMWREAYQTVEDIFALGIHDQNLFPSATRAKVLASVAVYYEKLSQVFWKADLLLFHAQAAMRHMLHTRTYQKSVSGELLEGMASAAVLAVLSIPSAPLSDPNTDSTTTLENHRRFAALLGSPIIPSRDTLRAVLNSRNILKTASDYVQKLYRTVESETVEPLELCQLCAAPFEEIARDPKLSNYITPLKSVIIHKLMNQLSEVYSSMSLDCFSQICPSTFIPWREAERIVVRLVYNKFLDVRLDYSSRSIYFTSGNIEAEATRMCRQLSSFGQMVSEVMSQLEAEKYASQNVKRRTDFYLDIDTKMEQEENRLRKRHNDVRARHEEQIEEQRRQDVQKRQMELRKQEEEERQEMCRRAEEQKRREDTRRKEALDKEKRTAAEAIMEELKRLSATCFRLAARNKDADKEILIRGMSLASFDAEKISKGLLSFEDFEKVFNEIKLRERQEKMSSRRNQAKKIDHLLRAMQEEELPALNAWERSRDETDRQYIEEVERQHKEDCAECAECVKEHREFKTEIQNRELASRRVEMEEEEREYKQRVKEVLRKEKVSRARRRKAQAEEEAAREKAEREAAELQQKKEREERERIERAEAAEKAKREAEAKREALYEMQRKKEREIEERAERERQEMRRNIGGGGFGGDRSWRTTDRGDPDDDKWETVRGPR